MKTYKYLDFKFLSTLTSTTAPTTAPNTSNYSSINILKLALSRYKKKGKINTNSNSSNSLTENEILQKKNGIKISLSNHDKLKIASNIRIKNYPHPKIDPKLSQSQSIMYFFNNIKSNINNKERVKTILEYFFYSFFSSISKPVFIETPNKLIIRLYYVIGTIFEFSPSPEESSYDQYNNKKNFKKIWIEKMANQIDYVMKNKDKKAPKNKKALLIWKILSKRTRKLNKILLNKKIYSYNSILSYAFKLYKINKIRRNKTRFKSTLVYPLKNTQELKQKVKGKWYYAINYPNLLNKNISLNQAQNVNRIYWWLQINNLKRLLFNLFKKEIEIQLVRLYNIGHDPYILAKSVSANTKTFNFRFLLTKLWKKVSVYKSSKIILTKNRILKNITFSSEQLLPIENFFLNYNDHNSSQKYTITQNTNLNKKTSIINSKKLNINVPSNILYDNIDNYKDIITNPVVPAKTTGIKIRLAGRLKTERFKPRKTVQTVQIGSLSKDLTNCINSAAFTSKNKKGAFNIKVWMSSSYY